MPFVCSRPIDALTMIWNGTESIRVVPHKGDASKPVAACMTNMDANCNDVSVGEIVTVSGLTGSPNDIIWELFRVSNGTKLGNSDFHISCSDRDMDGAEDCGKAEGDGKGLSGFINEWIFEGMVDSDQVLDCTP